MKKMLLFLSVLFAGSLFAQDCTDLFFSEYVEGSANNKCLEIYNPTDNTIDLSLYEIKRYSNGSPLPTDVLSLEGSLAPGEVFVVTNGQTDSVWVSNGGYWSLPISEELYELGDFHCSGIYPTPMYFNGNDAMTLEKITGEVVDIFGKTGVDPGSNGWNDIPPTYYAGDDWWTSWSKDQTLIRKHTVLKGVNENPALFMVNMEWDSLPKNTYDSLGFHRCNCSASSIDDLVKKVDVNFYPNPLTGNELTIESSEFILELEITNAIGQRILIIKPETTEKQLVAVLPEADPGVYLARIRFNDHQSVVKKLIIR